MNKLALLDRDGVINEDIGYLHEISRCQFIDGVFDLAKGLVEKGFKLIVITNQSGIARGMFTEQDYHKLMTWINQSFANNQAPISANYFCPHHPSKASLSQYLRDCDCRKPKPGMLLQALKQFQARAEDCLLIGDSERDIEAAKAARIGKTFLFRNSQPTLADYRVDHLIEVLDYV